MLKKIISLAVALCLLFSCSIPACATAGSADDPLVSESYAETWASGLLTELIGKAKERLEQYAANPDPKDGSSVHALPANSLVTLRSGAVITLLSGTAKVAINKGDFVNATVGGAAINGRVIPGHTYIVCENGESVVTITANAVVRIEGRHAISPAQGTVTTPTPIPSPTATPVPTPTPAPTPTPSVTPTAVPTPVVIVIEPTPVIIYVTVTPTPTPSATPTALPSATPAATKAPAVTSVPTSPTAAVNVSFKDVSASAWFYDDLKLTVKEGMMAGTSRTEFSPGENLTVAEAIELTAKLHARYSDEDVSLKKGFWLWWYKPYRSYALEQKLIDESYGDYSRRKMNSPVTKGELTEMLYRALPADCLTPINTVDDNAIPDVKDFSTNAAGVYALYRAGILTGYLNAEGVADHSFKAHETLTRGETAVFVARILDADRRVEFTLTASR